MSPRYLDPRNLPPRSQENGRWLCRGCGKPLSGRRKAWCSDDCRISTLIRYGIGVRDAVFDRDHGICARCGLSTDLLERALREIRAKFSRGKARDIALLLGLNPDRATHWDAHHKTAVIEGGGAATLDGFETLCERCHKAETAELAGRRATNGKKTC